MEQAEQKPKKILFVCLGNICRSPAAEGIFRDILESHGQIVDDSLAGIKPFSWKVDSAGTGGWHIGDLPDPRMRQHASRRGYSLTHHARQVRESDFDEFDLIIPMDSSNVDSLRRLAPTAQAQGKIHPMAEWLPKGCRYDHIPDPYYDGYQGFETVLDLLESALHNLYADLSNEDTAQS